MTNNQLAENSVIQLLNSVKLARDNAERADNRVDHSFYYALTIALEELQERRKADSEPVAYISKSDFDAGYPHILARRDFNKACTMAVYAAQPAPIVEREPIAWLNDAYLARGVVDGEAGSEDAGPGYIPVYRHAQQPVVPKDHQIRELVNQLRDIAIEYHGTQQLRERIARVLRAAMLNGGKS